MKSSKYTVTTTAQIVVPAKNYNREIYTHVIGNGIVYLGGSDVLSTNGTPSPAPTAAPAPSTADTWNRLLMMLLAAMALARLPASPAVCSTA